jgi:hypothetical protein
MRSYYLLTLAAFMASAAFAETPVTPAAAPTAVPATTPAAAQETTPATTPAAAPTYWEAIRKVTESYVGEAQKSATSATETATAWTQEDIANAGTWLYKVEVVALDNPQALEAKLAAIGKERWELVSLTQDAGKMYAIFKKPAVSNLGALIQMAPFMSGMTKPTTQGSPQPQSR